MPDYTLELYSLDQIPGVSAGSTNAGGAFNTGGTVTFTDIGTSVTITDDDEYAEDVIGQVNPETGANAVLTDTVTVDGATYSAGTRVNAVAQVEVTNNTTGETGFAQIFAFGGASSSASYLTYPFSVSDGDSLTFTATDLSPDEPFRFGDTQGYAYSEFDGAPPSTSDYTIGLYPLEQIPGVSAGAILAGEAFMSIAEQ